MTRWNDGMRLYWGVTGLFGVAMVAAAYFVWKKHGPRAEAAA
jgi:hypothetical protein